MANDIGSRTAASMFTLYDHLWPRQITDCRRADKVTAGPAIAQAGTARTMRSALLAAAWLSSPGPGLQSLRRHQLRRAMVRAGWTGTHRRRPACSGTDPARTPRIGRHGPWRSSPSRSRSTADRRGRAGLGRADLRTAPRPNGRRHPRASDSPRTDALVLRAISHRLVRRHRPHAVDDGRARRFVTPLAAAIAFGLAVWKDAARDGRPARCRRVALHERRPHLGPRRHQPVEIGPARRGDVVARRRDERLRHVLRLAGDGRERHQLQRDPAIGILHRHRAAAGLRRLRPR